MAIVWPCFGHGTAKKRSALTPNTKAFNANMRLFSYYGQGQRHGNRPLHPL